MGNRVSISFVDGKRESVVLFSHWGGKEFVLRACEYVMKLRKMGEKPLENLSPQKVMKDFIREIKKDTTREKNGRCWGEDFRNGDIYLGKNYLDGDASDNGHHAINLRGPEFWWKSFLFPVFPPMRFPIEITVNYARLISKKKNRGEEHGKKRKKD